MTLPAPEALTLVLPFATTTLLPAPRTVTTGTRVSRATLPAPGIDGDDAGASRSLAVEPISRTAPALPETRTVVPLARTVSRSAEARVTFRLLPLTMTFEQAPVRV